MKVRNAMVAGGLAAAIVLAGCGNNENEARKLGTVTGSGTDTTIEPPRDANKVGDIVKLGNAELTVHGWKDPFDPGPMPGKKAGMRYVMVDAEVRNRSSEPQVLSHFAQFELKDSDGNTYTPIALPGNLPAVGGTAAPGEARRGNVGFEVPESAKGLQVIFNNMLFGGGTASIFLA